LRGDLGAVDRLRDGAQVLFQGGDVEAGEVEELDDAGVLQERTEVRCLIRANSQRYLHEVADAIPGRKLDQAQPVARRLEAHGLSVDGHDRAERQAWRKVAPVKDVVARQWIGAQEKTRTSTTLRPQVPETCASTNSATWASRDNHTAEARPIRG